MSSRISKSPIILTWIIAICTKTIQSQLEKLCFFMDEDKGNKVGFVEFPQAFENVTKNDVYSSSLNVIMEVSIKN